MSTTTDAGSSVFGQIATRTRSAASVGIRLGEVDTTLVNLFTFDFVLMIMLQKYAVPLGPGQIEMVVFPNLLTLGIALYLGRLVISPVRILLYLPTFGSAFLLQAFAPKFNAGSFLLSCVVALPFLAVASVTKETYFACLKRFQLVALVVVGLVFMDHAVQLFHLEMPDLEHIIPESFKYTNFNYIQPLFWNSPWMKPNAVFFLEASYASQFLAIALIMELALFQRFRLVMIYGAGLMAVFAGTGFILVLAAAPLIALKYMNPKFMLLGMLGLGIAGGVAFASGWADIMSSRTQEFDKAGASGNARFVAPFTSIVYQFTGAPTDTLFFGEGPGSQEKSADINLTPITKILLEYGLFTMTFYLIYTLYWIFGPAVPFICTWTIAVYFYVLSGGSAMPLCDIYAYLLVGGYHIIRPVTRIPRLTVDMLEGPETAGGGSYNRSSAVFG